MSINLSKPKRPGLQAIAVEGSGTRLTYAELDERANQMANLLHGRGVGRGDLVGVYFGTTVEIYAAIFGVLKAGAAYVPLDVRHPALRIRAIIDKARVPIVIAQVSPLRAAPVRSR